MPQGVLGLMLAHWCVGLVLGLVLAVWWAELDPGVWLQGLGVLELVLAHWWVGPRAGVGTVVYGARSWALWTGLCPWAAGDSGGLKAAALPVGGSVSPPC